MKLTLEVTFWLCVGMVAYNYVGYPIVLFPFGCAHSDVL